MGVLLLSPPIMTKLAQPTKKGPFSDVGENLGLSYLASSLRSKGIETEIYEPYLQEKSLDDVVEYLFEKNPDMIAISVPSIMAFHNVITIIKSIREKGYDKHITVGGHYATVCSKLVLEQTKADSLMFFEGEITIVELYQALEEKRDFRSILGIAYMQDGEYHRNELRGPITELDTLNFPARDNLEVVLKQGGYASIVTSRGCYGRCIFCSAADYQNAVMPRPCWRARSYINTVNEIELLNSRYGVDKFVVVDDSFIGTEKKGKERAIAIANEIVRRKLKIQFLIMCKPEEVDMETFSALKKAGLVATSIGVESGDDTVLKRFRRRNATKHAREALQVLRSLDIEVFIGLIPFDPKTSLEELNNTIQFLYSQGELNIANFRKRMMVLPGSYIEKVLKEEEKLVKGKYTIEDEKAEIICKILETASKNWGTELNCLEYQYLWENALENGGSDRYSKMFCNILNKESKRILDDVIEKADICVENPARLESVIQETEESIKQLYESLRKYVDFAKDIASYIDKIDQELDSQVEQLKEFPNLLEMCQYHMKEKGSRIIPHIAYAAAKIAQCDLDKTIGVVAAIELFHNFTLVHDDIIDTDETRRGQASVWKNWSIEEAIIAGDSLFALSMLNMSEIGQDVSKEIYHSILNVMEGEILDIKYGNSEHVSFEESIRMTGKKSGETLGTVMKSIALLAGKKGEKVDNIYKIGYNVGVFLQIENDLFNIYNDKMIERYDSSDILHKKKTLPILYALQNASQYGYQEIKKDYLENEQVDAKAVCKMISGTSGHEFALLQAQRYKNYAIDGLQRYESDTGEDLHDMQHLLQEEFYLSRYTLEENLRELDRE